MATTRHYWVCPRCQTPNAVGVTRCRACDAEAVDPVDSSVAEPGRTGQAPEVPPHPPVAPQAAPAGVTRPAPAVTQTVGRRSHSQITRCPRCGMTHQGLVWFCERCGLDILGRGPTSTTTATVTRPTSSRSPVRRLLVLAILLAGFAVASALALLEITDTPGAVDQETPDQAVLTAPLDGSPAPLASAPDTAPAPPATTASPAPPSAAPETPAPETPAPADRRPRDRRPRDRRPRDRRPRDRPNDGHAREDDHRWPDDPRSQRSQ